MPNDSGSPTASFELLLQEIEATPKEYWAELLANLRQFRQKNSLAAPTVINVEQAKQTKLQLTF